jgi:hypothetical protein|nr:MAG TPA_asm: hypothetical protein [Caudoviricetes sp.]
MKERIQKIRAEHPDFDKKMVDMFAESMPKLMLVLMDGQEYECHIGSKDVAEKKNNNSLRPFLGRFLSLLN